MQALLRIPRMTGKAIMAALPAMLKELAEQAAFRLYVAEALYAHGNGLRLTRRFVDIINGGAAARPITKADADAMAARLGITFTEV